LEWKSSLNAEFFKRKLRHIPSIKKVKIGSGHCLERELSNDV